MTSTLQRLDFVDFQSLKKTSIELSPYFNLIVGSSNLGKSAALRAAKALAKNAPATGLVREGAKQFEITATFADGTTETLVKGKNKSEFILGDEKFAKAGAYEVPEQVADLWRVSDICFTTQHDAPFLLAESPATVAKTLGDLTNASMLMRAIAEANKLRTQHLNDFKAREREAEEVKEELLSHAGLSAREKAVAAARQAHSAAQKLQQQYDTLQTLLNSHLSLEEDAQRVPQINISLDDIDAQHTQITESVTATQSLTALKQEHLMLIQRERQLFQIGVPLNDLEYLLEKTNSAAQLPKTLSELRVKCDKIVQAERQLELAKKAAIDNVAALEGQLHDLIGETCPVCGQEISS